MSIPAVVKSEAEIPEGLASHYTEEDGQWLLQVDAVEENGSKWELTDSRALTSALESKKGSVRELKGKLSKYEKLGDPDELSAAVEFYGKHKDTDPEKVEERFRTLSEQKLKQAQDEHAQEVEKLNARILNLTAGRDVAEAIAAAGGAKQEYAALLEEHVAKHVAVREVGGKPISVVLDTDGEPVTVKGSMQPISVADWVKETIKPKFPDMFLGKNAGGGDAHKAGDGTGGGKTVSRSEWDKMAPIQQTKHISEGGTVVDG